MFSIDITSNQPIYEQIVQQIKANIVKGYLKENDPLPSVRKLSSMLSVNPNTVAKAYSELERQQIILTIRGRGTFIGKISNSKNSVALNDELEKIKPVLTELKLKGVEDNLIIEEIKNILKNISEQ